MKDADYGDNSLDDTKCKHSVGGVLGSCLCHRCGKTEEDQCSEHLGDGVEVSSGG